MGFGFLGDLLGFQSGGVPGGFEPSGLINVGGTREGVDKLLALLSDLLDAAQEGGGRFLRDTFDIESGRALRGVATSREGAEQRLLESMNRIGDLDPVARTRLLADLDRSFGSLRAGTQSNLAVSQSRRREAFPFNVIGAASPFLTAQQGLGLQEAGAERRADLTKSLLSQSRRSADAGAARNLIGGIAGLFGKGGGGGSGGGGFSLADIMSLFGGGNVPGAGTALNTGGGALRYNPLTDSFEASPSGIPA